jgi:hypothetical protein
VCQEETRNQSPLVEKYSVVPAKIQHSPYSYVQNATVDLEENGTRERWLQNELTKPSGAPYESLLPELIEERAAIFVAPVDEW